MKKIIFSLSVALMTLFFISCEESDNNMPKPNKKNNTISNIVSKLTIKEFFNDKLVTEHICDFDYDEDNRISELNVEHYELDATSGATKSTKTKTEVEFEYSKSSIKGTQTYIDEKGLKKSEQIITTKFDANNKPISSEFIRKYVSDPENNRNIKYTYKYDDTKNIVEILSSEDIHNIEIKYNYKWRMKWENANLTQIYTEDETNNYTYAKILNNSNIDLNIYGALLSSPVVFFRKWLNMINLDLCKSKNLTESFATSTIDMEYSSENKNTFELDKNNRVVKIITFSKMTKEPKAKKIKEIEISYK